MAPMAIQPLTPGGGFMAKITFLRQPGKEHSDRGHMLFNGCRRARMLFDVCCHCDRFNILQVPEAGALAPIQELADGMIVSDPRVFVADGNGNRKK